MNSNGSCLVGKELSLSVKFTPNEIGEYKISLLSPKGKTATLIAIDVNNNELFSIDVGSIVIFDGCKLDPLYKRVGIVKYISKDDLHIVDFGDRHGYCSSLDLKLYE